MYFNSDNFHGFKIVVFIRDKRLEIDLFQIRFNNFHEFKIVIFI